MTVVFRYPALTQKTEYNIVLHKKHKEQRAILTYKGLIFFFLFQETRPFDLT